MIFSDRPDSLSIRIMVLSISISLSPLHSKKICFDIQYKKCAKYDLVGVRDLNVPPFEKYSGVDETYPCLRHSFCFI